MILIQMISIIIPAHNEFDNLAKLLPRLGELMAGESETEVILALSKSTSDKSKALGVAAGARVLDCSGTGRAVQMNTAAAIAEGDILVFLHADVFPPAGFISNIKDTLASGYKAGFFSYRFDSNHWLLKINSSFTARDGLFTGGGDQCLFIEKDIFFELGCFDQEQVLMEDFEFFRRMKKKNVPYRIVPNNLLVSARKYQHNSYWRVNLTNLLLLLLFKMRIPARRLQKIHHRMLNLPYSNT